LELTSHSCDLGRPGPACSSTPVLYEHSVKNERDPLGGWYISTFLVLLPAFWWFVGAVPAWFQLGWDHDPRFYTVYWPGLIVTQWWLSWPDPGYAFVVQNAAVAICGCALAALPLARLHWWRGHPLPRMVAAVLSLALPWLIFGEPVYLVRIFFTAYAVCVLVGGLAPFSAQGRGALLGVALALGVTLAAQCFESWAWPYSGALLAAFVLLGYATVRGLLGRPGFV
jgi:hypothetical protein